MKLQGVELYKNKLLQIVFRVALSRVILIGTTWFSQNYDIYNNNNGSPGLANPMKVLKLLKTIAKN